MFLYFAKLRNVFIVKKYILTFNEDTAQILIVIESKA
jgi:hypothetical protein